ncbi:MAG TPA: EamA family transporter [Casimicrobiaceae bacterium]|nr:EamA family transporter [Casimicrobiaceae bacterium]
MNAHSLFAICTLIWGSTWLVITFQLGVVAPEASVAYRFGLAAVLIALWCVVTRRSLVFPLRAHVWFVVQGATFFGLNYVGVYLAERHITSGLVAVVFSTIVFMSPFFARIAFNIPIRTQTTLGALIGVAGVMLMFVPESGAQQHGSTAVGIAYAFGSTAIAAIGNLASMRVQREGWPLIASTAWGMAYGALIVALFATLQGTQWTFDASASYVVSLAYLAVFGSVVAFIAYLELLRKVGPGPSSFVGVSTPVIAMLLSTLFEGYRWSALAALGVALAVAGNVIALRPAALRT